MTTKPKKAQCTNEIFSIPGSVSEVPPVIYFGKKNGLGNWNTFHINPQEWNLSKSPSMGHQEVELKDPGARVSRITGFLVLIMPLTHCVTLGKSLPRSGPPFAHLQNVVVAPEVSQRSFQALMNGAWNFRLLNSSSLFCLLKTQFTGKNKLWQWLWGSSVGECL